MPPRDADNYEIPEGNDGDEDCNDLRLPEMWRQVIPRRQDANG